MKKKTLSPALLLVGLLSSGLLATGLSVNVMENKKSIQSEKEYQCGTSKDLGHDEEAGEYMMWESVARHLLTFNR